MISFLDFVLISLAVWQALEIWHHGEIFRTWRESVRFCRFENISYLSQCMFCLSVWAAFALVLANTFLLGQLFILVLAVSRTANLCNDVFYSFCRTPKDDSDVEVTEETN